MNVTELLQNLEAIRNTKIFFVGRVLAIRRDHPACENQRKKCFLRPSAVFDFLPILALKSLVLLNFRSS